MVRFCKDCKYSTYEGFPSLVGWWCSSKAAGARVNLVDGELQATPCDRARYAGGPCGQAGKFWEPKP